MFKEAWPSSDKLERLKLSGETPYSQEALRFLCAAALFVYYSQKLPEIIKLLKLITAVKTKAGFLDSINIYSDLNIIIIIYPALMLGLIVFIVTLIKRRFVVNFSALSPDFSRFSPWLNFKKNTPFVKLSNALILFVAAAILIGPAGYLLFGILLKSTSLLVIEKTLNSFLLISAVSFLIMSGISFICAWGSFFVRHRMSREELKQENSGRSRDYVERL